MSVFVCIRKDREKGVGQYSNNIPFASWYRHARNIKVQRSQCRCIFGLPAQTPYLYNVQNVHVYYTRTYSVWYNDESRV